MERTKLIAGLRARIMENAGSHVSQLVADTSDDRLLAAYTFCRICRGTVMDDTDGVVQECRSIAEFIDRITSAIAEHRCL